MTSAAKPVRVFYDGTCGLCHWFVLFLLKHDREEGGAFRFAPLGGESFLREVPEAKRAGLPDSVVVVAEDGQLLTRSDGVLLVLERLGGSWAGWARIGRLKPRFLRDWAYDAVAAVRRRLFRRPDDVCPVVPQNLRNRFDP